MRGPGVKGSGIEATERRTISDFSNVSVNGAYTIFLNCGSAPSLTITGDDNLLPLIKNEVQNGTLKIYSARPVSPKIPIVVHLTTRSVSQVVSDGASTIHIENDSTTSLSLSINGSGNMDAAGSGERAEYTVNGAETFSADEFQAREVAVTINGTGTATVYSSESLEATVVGAGTVSYYGNPGSVKRNITGVGSIVRKNP